MKSISFLKDPATFVVLAGMMLGLGEEEHESRAEPRRTRPG